MAKNKIYKNYIYNLIYQLLILVLPLVTSSLLTRKLGAENLGIYSYVSSVISIISTFGLLGLYNYGTREVAYCNNNNLLLNKLYSEIFIIRVLLVALITIPYVAVVSFTEYKIYFYIEIIYLIGYFLDPSWVFVGKEDMGKTVLKNVFAKLFSFIGILIFVNSNDDLWIYFLLIALSIFIGNLTLYIGIKKHVHFSKPSLKSIRYHLIGSFKLFVPQIATLLYLQIDKIMLKFIAGASSVAIYEYSEKIINMPLAIITVFGTVMLPRLSSEFASKNQNDFDKHISTSVAVQSLLAFPMMFGLFAISSDFIPWFYSNEFADCSLCIKILCPLILGNTLINIFSAQYLTATNQTKIMTLSYSLTLLFNVIVNIFFIYKFSYYGAAITTVLSSFICALIQFCCISKSYPIHSFFKSSIKYFLNGIVMFIIVLILSCYLPSKWYSTIFEFGIGVIVYLIGLLVIKDKTIINFIHDNK